MLYVEDEPLIAMDVEAMLHDLGFEDVVIALTLDDARMAVRERKFDLAIMDINLGGGQTSLPLVEMLRPHGTRVVMASGYNSDTPLGAANVPRIEKPFDEAVLLRAVLEAMT